MPVIASERAQGDVQAMVKMVTFEKLELSNVLQNNFAASYSYTADLTW